MRASRSPRRSLPGFAVDMALRDMRRKPDPVFAEMLDALRNLANEMRYMLRTNPNKDGGLYRQRLTEAEAVIAKAEGRING